MRHALADARVREHERPLRVEGGSHRSRDPLHEGEQRPELVVCASGNLALIYFPRLPGRVSLETIDQTWPGMTDKLVAHPGIGILMGRSSAHGAIAMGTAGRRYLESERVLNVATIGPSALTGPKRW